MLHPPRSSSKKPDVDPRLTATFVLIAIFFLFIFMLVSDAIWAESPGTMWKTLVHDYYMSKFEMDPYETKLPRDDDWKGFAKRRCACVFVDLSRYKRPDDYGEEADAKNDDAPALIKGWNATSGRTGTRCTCVYSNSNYDDSIWGYEKVEPHA